MQITSSSTAPASSTSSFPLISSTSPTSNVVVRSPRAISIRKYIYTRDQSPFSNRRPFIILVLTWSGPGWPGWQPRTTTIRSLVLCTHCSTSARYKILIPVPALVSSIHTQQRPFMNSNPSAASLLRTSSTDMYMRVEDEIIVEAGFRYSSSRAGTGLLGLPNTNHLIEEQERWCAIE